MRTTSRSTRAIPSLGLLVGCGVLALALGCRGSAVESPDPAPAAGGEQGNGGQAGQASDAAGTSAGTASGGAGTEHTGPWALDGSEEGPVAGLPLIVTLDVPEVPEKIRNPTQMPGN